VLALHLPTGSRQTPVELSNTPFFAQEEYQCGPAALATVLSASGVDVSPRDLVPQVYLPGRKGSLQIELSAAARRRGRLPYPIAPQMAALLAEISAGRPVLVLQNLGLESYPIWHYAVVVGFDPGRDELILRSGARPRARMSATRFLRSWEQADSWGLVLLRPGELPAFPSREPYLDAASAMEDMGQSEAAAAAYAAALELWPSSEIAWLGLGNSRYAGGDLEGAESAYRVLLEISPGNVIALNNLAQVLSERGCPCAALKVLRLARDVPTLPPDLRESLGKTEAEIRERQIHWPPPGSGRCGAAR
jgi:tetratricopeptide (TPR) repeat protein